VHAFNDIIQPALQLHTCLTLPSVGFYYRFWWFTPPGSEERRKTAFQVDGIVQGSLRGKGVAIIQNKPGGELPDRFWPSAAVT
jgi:hypothetical protein